MDFETLKRSCLGLDAYSAKNKILSLCPELTKKDIEIMYYESDYKRFIVTDCKLADGKIMLSVTSKNPIRNLPSIYQENTFLSKFLMIFQHISNDISISIDNMYKLFRPMSCPKDFLSSLSDWFGINLSLFDTEEKKRLILQYAIPLFKLRGTALGLKIFIYIATGYVTSIIENHIPYEMIAINENTKTEGGIFDIDNGNSAFTIQFPCERNDFSDEEIIRLSALIKEEKPVETDCYISFKEKAAVKRRKSIINENTELDGTFMI